MKRRDFFGKTSLALMAIIFPWKKEKRFHHEWYTTITVTPTPIVAKTRKLKARWGLAGPRGPEVTQSELDYGVRMLGNGYES